MIQFFLTLLYIMSTKGSKGKSTSTHKTLSDTGSTRLTTLLNRIREFKNHNQIDAKTWREFEAKIKRDVTNASDQARYALKLLDNAKTNAGRATTFEELLASDLPPTAPPAEGPSTPLKPPSVKKSKGQSKLKFKKE